VGDVDIVAASSSLLSPSRPRWRIRWTLYAIGIGVWLSGVLWWVFDHFLRQRSEFGPVPSPLQFWWLRLHAATALAAVWLFGYLCASHVLTTWPARLRRVSGVLFVAAFALLILSGYLLYYVTADRARTLIGDVHWAVGLCAPLAFLAHRGFRRSAQRPG